MVIEVGFNHFHPPNLPGRSKTKKPFIVIQRRLSPARGFYTFFSSQSFGTYTAREMYLSRIK
jgi:hypothetical protein